MLPAFRPLIGKIDPWKLDHRFWWLHGYSWVLSHHPRMKLPCSKENCCVTLHSSMICIDLSTENGE
jgi:hypothetical protein